MAINQSGVGCQAVLYSLSSHILDSSVPNNWPCTPILFKIFLTLYGTLYFGFLLLMKSPCRFIYLWNFIHCPAVLSVASNIFRETGIGNFEDFFRNIMLKWAIIAQFWKKKMFQICLICAFYNELIFVADGYKCCFVSETFPENSIMR